MNFHFCQICDKISYPIVIAVIGNIVLAVAFIFLGPLPFLAIEPQLSLIRGACAAVGLGYAMTATSSFIRAQSAAIKLGYEDNINTYIMISGYIFFKIYSFKILTVLCRFIIMIKYP